MDWHPTLNSYLMLSAVLFAIGTVNHRFPSWPAAMCEGIRRSPSGYSVTAPSIAIRPMRPGETYKEPTSVNQSAPSAPVTIASGFVPG